MSHRVASPGSSAARFLLGGLAARELVLAKEAREVFEPVAKRGTPSAEGVETGGEGRRHRGARWLEAW